MGLQITSRSTPEPIQDRRQLNSLQCDMTPCVVGYSKHCLRNKRGDSCADRIASAFT